MKIFIVLALFAAAASASVIQSPALGYNPYGYTYETYGNPYGLNAGLVSGVRYAAPVATRVVAPISTVGVRAYRPVVSSPLVAPVAAYGVRSAAYGVAPVSAYGINAAPLVSNVVAPSVYSNYGTGLYGNGYFAKKV